MSDAHSLGLQRGEYECDHDDALPLLSLDEVKRYGRQLVMPKLGRRGQERLKASRVLIVGAGGLGSPVGMYLAAAGIGRIGVVDHDVLEVSNLNRQIAHSTDKIGCCKSTSLVARMRSINDKVEYIDHSSTDAECLSLNKNNAERVCVGYDVIIDCTDNPSTRYILNDTCVNLGLPLVAGSALQFQGQLSVYNAAKDCAKREDRGPCYRCVFPRAGPPSASTNCDDSGILGPAAGCIGAIQAAEAVKLCAFGTTSYSGRMLYVDFFAGQFRTVNLRKRQQESCLACLKRIKVQEYDYDSFCGVQKCGILKASDNQSSVQRASVFDLKQELDLAAQDTMFLDVRPRVHFGIVRLPGFENVPLDDLREDRVTGSLTALRERCAGKRVFIICRRGIDSLEAAEILIKAGHKRDRVWDVLGGLEYWAKHVNPNFPVY